MKQHLALSKVSDNTQPRLRERFEEWARKLEKRVARFDPDLVHLEGHIEQHPARPLYRSRLRLKLGNGVLATTEEGEDALPVLDEAFRELERRLEKFKARLSRSDQWKRPSRRRRLVEWLKETPEAREREKRQLYFDLIREHLDNLHSFIRRELAYLENRGEVPPGELTAEDLLDATVLRGFQQFEQRPAHQNVHHWLLGLAIDVTSEEVATLRRQRTDDAQPLWSRPKPGPADAWLEDEQQLEFWTPDESLRLEDLVPATGALSPEEETASRELQQHIQQTLAQLPAQWRQAVVLTTQEDLTPDQAAALLDRDPDTLRAWLDHAHAYLAARLEEQGHSIDDLSEQPLDFIADTVRIPLPEDLRRELRDLAGQL